MTSKTLEAKLFEYTSECLKECINISENAASLVAKIIDSVIQDAGRVSKMPKDTLDALKKVREDSNLVEALTKLNNEHVDVGEFTFPIIQALQFQDRIRQQMENMVKMTSIWCNARKTLSPSEDLEKALHDFGIEILKITVTDEERAAIRAAIPSLPVEQKVENSALFF